ncbi:hypothetical protein [Flavobacterium beibuense]|nr:hypothetical protein [Flavobacterium beibuense]
MMFDKYSFKIKFRALIAIFFILLFTSYKRSFSTLIGVVKENSELKDKVADLKNTSSDYNLLQSQIAAIDKIIGKEGINKEKIQQDIIDFITSNGKKTSIYHLQSIHEFSDDNYHIYTNEVDITGELNDLLKLTYDFEIKFNNSRLISMDFYTARKTNQSDILHLKLIFQNYENKK